MTFSNGYPDIGGSTIHRYWITELVQLRAVVETLSSSRFILRPLDSSVVLINQNMLRFCMNFLQSTNTIQWNRITQIVTLGIVNPYLP
jgi:hypothetical protein